MTTKADLMAFFWDLASEDLETRLKSSRDIVTYVVSLPIGEPASASTETDAAPSTTKAKDDDADYTLKRLIKGLSSSREGARQGFSTCLCEILKLPRFNISESLHLIEENTKLATATKGSEERDMMFGKLFGYLSIVRSGRVNSDAAMISNLFDKTIALLSSKSWIRELVCESILIILNSFDASITAPLIGRLADFFPESVNLFEPWQIMLGLGLEFLRSSNHLFKEQVNKVLPQKHLFTAETFPVIESALLSSTFGFPKIHRVWDFILGKIFGFDKFSLPTTRVSSINAYQLEMLTILCRFIDSDMISFSNEKRGVAMKLVAKMLSVVPTDLLSVALTPGTVACLMKVRRPVKNATAKGGKHLLHALAGAIIHEMVAVALKGDSAHRLALASVIVQHNGANFDNVTGIPAVQSLLTDLDEKSIESYMAFLISTLSPQSVHSRANNLLQLNQSSSSNNINSKNNNMSTGEDSNEALGDEVHDDYATICEKGIITSIDALASLCSNQHLAHRSYICSVTCAVLMRIGIFDTSIALDSKIKRLAFRHSIVMSASNVTKSAKKDKKKDKKKDSEETENQDNLFGFSTAAIDKLLHFLTILDGSNGVTASSSESSLATPSKASASSLTTASELTLSEFSENVKSYAASKLLSILADTAKLTSHTSAGAAGDASDSDSVFTLYLSILNNLVTIQKLPIRLELDENKMNESEGDDQNRASLSPFDVTLHCLHIIQGLTNQLQLKSNSTKDEATPFNQTAIGRLVGAFSDYLSFTLFHVIASNDVPVQVLNDAIMCGQQIFGYEISTDMALEEGQEDLTEEEKQDSAYIALFDTCMEVLSIPAEHSLKGVRSAIMKIWNSLAAITSASSGNKNKGSQSKIAPVSEAVILSIVEAVIGEDVEREGDGEDGSEVEEEGGDDENEDDEEEEDEEDEEEEEDTRKSNSKSQDKSNNSKKSQIERDSKNKKIGGAANDSKDKSKEDEEEEEEDILVDNEKLMNMMENDFDFGTEGDILEHTEEADGALTNLINTQKAQRKAGILQRLRIVYLIRTRALGILEIMLNKEEDSLTLLSCLSPLISCLRIVTKSSSVGSIHEGRTFAQKLSSIIDQKICKKKFSLSGEEGSEIDFESLNSLLTSLESDLMSNSPSMAPMRFIASQCFLCLARPAFSNCSKEVNSEISSICSNLFSKYINSKNNKIPVKMLDELVSKYPDFVVSLALDALIQGCGETGRSTYLKTEAARFISDLFKKFKSLESKSHSIMMTKIPDVISALQKFLNDSISNVTDSTQLPAKRLKAIISSLKEIIQVLTNVQSAEPIKITKGIHSSMKSLESYLKGDVSQNAKSRFGQSNEKLVDQLLGSLAKFLIKQSTLSVTSSVSAHSPAPSSNESSKKEKKEGKDKKDNSNSHKETPKSDKKRERDVDAQESSKKKHSK